MRASPPTTAVSIAIAVSLGLAPCPGAAGDEKRPAREFQAKNGSLELVVLGSGGPGATGRASSSYIVVVDETPRILVDAGPGSFARLGEAGLPLAKVDVVLLTHLHADHAAELPGFFKARAVSGSGPIRFLVFGPDGRRAEQGLPAFPSTSRFIDLMFGPDGAFAYLPDFAAPMTFRVVDLPTRGGVSSVTKKILVEGDLVISAVAGHHGDAPSVIYRIDHAGRSITFSGDIDAMGLPALRRLAEKTSLLVFDAAVLDPPLSPEILYTLHTPPQAIGLLARQSAVQSLLLSHLSPAVDHERAAVTASIARHYAGPVSFAEDRLRLSP